MNKARRNEIQKCIDELEDIKSRLESVRDDEYEAYNNLPEGLMYSEKGDTMQEYIDDLDSEIGNLEYTISNLQDIVER